MPIIIAADNEVEQHPRISDIYEKFVKGDRLTDAECEYGAIYFRRVACDLIGCGPIFKLAANEAQRVWVALQSFSEARAEKKRSTQ